MHLTLRTLLAYLDDTLEPAETQDIGRQIAEAPPQIQELIDRVKRVMRQRRLLTPDAEGAGSQAVDPNTIAAYIDNALPAEEVVALETLCLQSDVHLAEVAACHQIMTVARSEPMPVPPTAHRAMYGLAHGREAIPTRTPPMVRRVGTDGDGTAGEEQHLMGLPWLRVPGAKGQRLVPVAAVILLMACGLFVLVMALNMAGDRTRPNNDQQIVKASPSQPAPIASATASERPQPPDSTPVIKKPIGPSVEPPRVALESVPTIWSQETSSKAAKPEARQALCSSVLNWGGWAAVRPSVPASMFLTVVYEKALASVEPPPAPPPAETLKPPVKPPVVDKVPPPSPAKVALAQYLPAVVKDSILIRRAQDGDWKTVKPLTRLQTSDLLLTPAGYRSDITLDNGMKLQMVGTLPAPGAAVANLFFESALTLHQNTEIDLDMTVERGRVIIFNKKPDPGTVRLRFLNQVWDMRLLQPNTAVGIEIYGRMPVAAGPWQPVMHMTLLTSGGELELKRGEKPETLPANQRIEFSNGPGAVANLPAQPLSEVPTWFKPPYRLGYPDQTIAITMLYQKLISEKPPETKWLVEACREALEEKPLEKYLAIATLGAIDQLPLLFTTLETGATPELRRMCLETLWHWIGRQPGQDAVLKPILLKSEYTEEEAGLILKLLRGYEPPKPVTPKETVEQLVRLLNHPRLSIRELAAHNLRAFTAPDNLKGYDPAAADDVRAKAIETIKARLKI